MGARPAEGRKGTSWAPAPALALVLATMAAGSAGCPAPGLRYRAMPGRPSAALYDALGDSVAYIRMMIDHGKRRDVQRRYWAKLVRDPDVADARLLYALTLENDKDVARLIEAALEVAPDLYWGHVAKGELLAREKRWPEAVTSFERALSINGNPADAHLGLAHVYRATDHLEDARGIYRELATSHPDNAAVFVEMGELARGLGEKHAAMEAYARAAAIDPERHAAHLALAELYVGEGDRDRALEAAERAAEVNPTSLKAHLIRARIFAEMKLTKESVNAYERALRGEPATVAADVTLAHEIAVARGSHYAARGDWGTAADAWTTATGARPDDVASWAALGRARLALEDLSAAFDAYKHAHELAPGDKDVARAHEDLLARLGAGGTTAHGGKTDAEVLAAVRTAVDKCYEKQLFYFPSLAGTIVVVALVDAAGRVIAASVASDTMGNADVSACARVHTLSAVFPAGTRGEKKLEMRFGKTPRK